MDLSKSYEFFRPEDTNARIHIIGCGSVGSTIAENLVRCGIKDITLYDFDNVETHNVHNQMFDQRHIGKNKAEALLEILIDINPEVKDTIKIVDKGWQGKLLSGYIFLAVDSIEVRRDFVEKHMMSPNVKAVFDVRTRLTDAQHYGADWKNSMQKKALLNSMQFSHDEAMEETPVSACGVTLGIVTTVRLICAMAVNNFIRTAKGEGTWKFVQMDWANGCMDCF